MVSSSPCSCCPPGANEKSSAARRLSVSAPSRASQPVCSAPTAGRRPRRRQLPVVVAVPGPQLGRGGRGRARVGPGGGLRRAARRRTPASCRAAGSGGCRRCTARPTSRPAGSGSWRCPGRRPARPPRARSRPGTPKARPTAAARPGCTGRSSRRWRPAACGAGRSRCGRPRGCGTGRSAGLRISSAGMPRSRTAASSSASGMPSSRRQSSATVPVLAVLSANSGTAACARSTNRATASAWAAPCPGARDQPAAGSSSGPISSACSAGTPSGSRLVVRMRSPGAAASSVRARLPQRLDQVLAGVEDQQQLPLGQARRQRLERVAGRLVGQPERGRHRAGQQLVVAQRGQLDQPAAVGEGVPDLARDPQREPGLAHPARPAQGDQPVLVDGGDDGRHFPPSADEPGHLGRQIVPLLAHRQRGHDAPRVVRPAV